MNGEKNLTILFSLLLMFYGCGLNFSSSPLPPFDSNEDPYLEIDTVEASDPNNVEINDGTELFEPVETVSEEIEIDEITHQLDAETEGEPECGNNIVEEGEECDDGRNGDDTDGCTDECMYSCHSELDCLDDNICNGNEICDDTTHTCQQSENRPNGFVCRQIPRKICLEGSCVESVCGDGFVDLGGGEFCEPSLNPICTATCTFNCTTDAECPDDGNPCNGQELCDTESVPVDPFFCGRRNSGSDGELCGRGGEDPPLICIGGICQESSCGDGYLDTTMGEECDDGNFISGDGCEPNCTFTCHDDAECEDEHGCTTDICSPTTHTCEHIIKEEGEICREAEDVCDVEEYCDGVSPDCPPDAYASNITECREQANECDLPEQCTGSSKECPPDSFIEAGVDCDDSNYCTLNDTCDGHGNCIGELAANLFNITGISAGYYHTCAVTADGEIRCWGRNTEGQLGDGTITDRVAPTPVTGLTDRGLAIAAGGFHSCAIVGLAMEVMCWGRGDFGQLGNGDFTNTTVPVEVVNTWGDLTIVMITCGRHHSCALLEDGSVYCWGRNTEGQLGDGTSYNSNVPVRVELPSGFGAENISAGRYHTCARGDTTILCWGYNANGELGDGTLINTSIPTEVIFPPDLPAPFQPLMVSTGGYHSCATLIDSLSNPRLYCWGRNNEGQIGIGTISDSAYPPTEVEVITENLTTIASGGYHNCLVTTRGATYCWGRNAEGQVGDGTTIQRPLPAEITPSSGETPQFVTTGFYHSCILFDSGQVKCWGGNGDGQLGDGTTTNKTLPAYVICN